MRHAADSEAAGKNVKGSTKEAGAEDTMVLRQELLQLQKAVWAPHNNSAVFTSVDRKKG